MSPQRDAGLAAETLGLGCGSGSGGGGRREGSKGVVDELAEQTRIDACADDGDLVGRERAVGKRPRVFGGEVCMGRGEK